jgi:hypothetical protein
MFVGRGEWGKRKNPRSSEQRIQRGLWGNLLGTMSGFGGFPEYACEWWSIGEGEGKPESGRSFYSSISKDLPNNEARKKLPYSIEDGTFVGAKSPHLDCVNDVISFPSGSSHALGSLVPD